MKKPIARKSKVTSKIRAGYTLMLRTCIRDSSGALKSYGGFTWPPLGPVECQPPHADFPLRHWDPEPKCGNGLHGFLRGVGDGDLADWGVNSVWLVVEIKADDVVDLGGKIKVPRGQVLFSGERLRALEMMAALGHLDDGHIGGTATAGDDGTATAGNRGTATAGDRGTATAGDHGTATAGYHGTATAGNRGTATAGNRGTATAGDDGTATAGYRGTATAGYHGTATAGNHGTATAGDDGTATAGYRGTATAGNRGTIQIKWWDGDRYRISTAYVGEDGITAGSKYQLDASGKFIIAQQVEQ